MALYIAVDRSGGQVFYEDMKQILSLLDWMQGDGRRAALFAGLGCLGVLLAALYYQHVVGLMPCHLCYLERKPHMAVVVLGALGFFLKAPKPRAYVLGLIVLLALFNAGVSLYHVGVEEHWWTGPATCASPTELGTTLEEARAQIFAAPIAVPCDIAVWFLFGISMAGWNGIISLGVAGWAAFATRRSWRYSV